MNAEVKAAAERLQRHKDAMSSGFPNNSPYWAVWGPMELPTTNRDMLHSDCAVLAEFSIPLLTTLYPIAMRACGDSEREAAALREAVAEAAFALWGCGDHKVAAAEQRFKKLMDEIGIDWNGDMITT